MTSSTPRTPGTSPGATALRRILVESFVRFRYGDGFTNSRALALQACLAVVPFLLAVTGLAADLDEERPATVVAHVVDAVSPGPGDDDALASRRAPTAGGSEEAGEVALVLGLRFALVSMTTAMAQVERGTNRIYGIRRDRPALRSTAAPRCSRPCSPCRSGSAS